MYKSHLKAVQRANYQDRQLRKGAMKNVNITGTDQHRSDRSS